MWGKQKLFKQRDELVQKLRGIRLAPAAEIDELRHCNENELKPLIKEMQRLYDEFFAPISAIGEKISTLAERRNCLQEQYDNIERKKEEILLEIESFEKGSREYARLVGMLQKLINEGKSLPPQIARCDESIKDATNRKTIREVLLEEERSKRIEATKDEVVELDVSIAKKKEADKKRKEKSADLDDMTEEVIQVNSTTSLTSEAEELIAKSCRTKQTVSTPAIPKVQQIYRNTNELKVNLFPLAEEEY
jgi:chromosome segregation ATPase